jgi:hypothetical protein
MVPVRYAVDPAAVHTAAGHAGEAGAAATRARAEIVGASDEIALWCPREIRGTVQAAVDALAIAAFVASTHSHATAARLTHAAEGYRVADGQRPV